MKKTFLIITAAVCVAFSGILLHGSMKNSDSSAIFDSMVEALTEDEGGSGIYTCHKDYFYKEGYQVRDCETCTIQDDHKASFWSLPDFCRRW